LDIDDVVVVYSKDGEKYDLWEAYKINSESSIGGESTILEFGSYSEANGLQIDQHEIWERRCDFQVHICLVFFMVLNSTF